MFNRGQTILTWNSIKIIITCVPKELAVGYRLMVGRQILILDVEVRALVPEPIPRDSIPVKLYRLIACPAASIRANIPNLRNYEYLP